MYWHARTREKQGRKQTAAREYRRLVGRYPLSWYAHLATARLKAQADLSPSLPTIDHLNHELVEALYSYRPFLQLDPGPDSTPAWHTTSSAII